MTNEDFLNDKFGKTYDSIDAGEKLEYLVEQMDWMQEYWVESWEQPPSHTSIRAYHNKGEPTETTGSCLLEAIENAQKEMNDE